MLFLKRNGRRIELSRFPQLVENCELMETQVEIASSAELKLHFDKYPRHIQKRSDHIETLVQNANTWAGTQVLVKSKISLLQLPFLPVVTLLPRSLLAVVTVSTAIRRSRQAALGGSVDPANRNRILVPGRDLAQNDGASLITFVQDEPQPTRQWSDGPGGSQVLGR